MNRNEADQLLTEILRQIKHECSNQESADPIISQQAFAALSGLYPTVMAATLQILDQGKVTKFICEKSRRTFYRVKESRKQSMAEEYQQKSLAEKTGSGAVFYDVTGDFCFCYFYAKQCLSEKGSSMLCKHVLAAKLAESLGETYPEKLTVKEIEDMDFQPLLLGSKNHLTKFEDGKKNSAASIA